LNVHSSRRKFLRSAALGAIGVVLSPGFRIVRAAADTSGVFRSRSALSMGSVLQVHLYGSSLSKCDEAIESVFSEFRRLEKLMNVFDETSQISRINREAFNLPTTADLATIELIGKARQLSRLTDQSFDITIEPLMKRYGFRHESIRSFPTDKELGEMIDSVGMDKIILDSRDLTVQFLHPLTRIDLGGIAVGYAIDRGVAILKERGIESALINHSGDLYALGSPPGEEAWTVGITDPDHTEDIITTVSIRNQALATSGNYEHFVEAGGIRIGHLLDPSTGKNSSMMLSGTVIAPTAIEADALSTGLFVLGIEKTRLLFSRLKRTEFISVIRADDGKELVRLIS
jgi:thiamine biosynthesis lipoprotein